MLKISSLSRTRRYLLPAVLSAGLIALALLDERATAVRILLLGLVILASGRATLLFVLGPAARDRRTISPPWDFVAIAFGGCVVFVVTMLLLAANAYTFTFAVSAVLAAGCLACLNAQVRRETFDPLL